jgi:hypothetical protein
MRSPCRALALCAFGVALGANACGSRALAPNGPFGGAAGSAGAEAAGTGAAGASSSTAGASAGASGAGTAGAAGANAGAGGGPVPPIEPTTPPPTTTLPISGSEALARISAVLWNQPPDGDVASAAALGRLATRADLADAVTKMLDDSRARVGVGVFFRRWLGLDALATIKKDPMVFPEATPELLADMADETTTFGVETTLDGSAGTYQVLLLAYWSFLNERLAAIYGLDGVMGDSLQFVGLPGARAGLLTQPALQVLGSFSARNSPPLRGMQLEERFLCQQIPATPPNVPPLPPPPSGVSMRQALQADEGATAVCNACHVYTDPPGLVFEGFDAIGRARTLDNGAPIDTSNLRIMLPSPQGPTTAVVDGPVELAKILATSMTAQNCFAQQWLAFALGRDVFDVGDDPTLRPSLAAIDASFQDAGLNLRSLIVAVLVSDAFLARH